MKIIYEATDGRKFNNKRDCLNHELKQKEYESAKTVLKQSELKLKELKSIYHYAIYKTKRTDCLNALLNLQKNETGEIFPYFPLISLFIKMTI